MVYLHDGGECIRTAATFNRNKDLLGWLMHSHIVDNDLVVGRSEERGKLLIQAAHEVAAFKVMKITKLHIRLRRHVGRPKCEGMNGRTFDVADKKDVLRTKGKHARRPQWTESDSTCGSTIRCRNSGTR